jgi:hypothetical protein
MLELPLSERLVFIEAATGSGKTEPACIWADRLVAAGLVDGMYLPCPLARQRQSFIPELLG